MKHFFKLLLSVPVLFSFSVSAATIPVFDWVAAYNTTVIDTNAVKGTAIDPVDGSVFVSNRFSGTGDLNPTSGTDSQSAVGGYDALLTKFDADGVYQWTKTWGGSGDDLAKGVTVSHDQTIVAEGSFAVTADFDPGLDTTYATSTGGYDTFLNFLDADGGHLSTATWGGITDDAAVGAIISDTDGNIYTFSDFTLTVDFDPGVGTAYATSSGSADVVLTKYSSDGVFQWARTWGSSGFDFPRGVSVDDGGNIFVNTAFLATVDFDPGPDTAYATSTGGYDAAVTKFSSDGIFQWVKVWGGTGNEFLGNVTASSVGDVYVFGRFSNTVDFDPGPDTVYATSTGSADVALSKFSSDGEFQWVRAWGGTGSETSNEVVENEDGTITVVGDFNATVDFDPSAGTHNKTSAGGRDVFISNFSADGDFLGVRTFGGTLDEWVDRVSRTPSPGQESSISVVGVYKSAPADFDPSSATANFSSDGNDMYLAVFDLIEATVTVTSTTGDLDEASGGTFDYDLVLSAPPQNDVVITVTPDAQVSVSTTSLTFASTTWDIAQTVTVTAINDEDIEDDPHTGTITHTAASDDPAYDGITVDSVTMSITEDDSSGVGGSSRSARAIQALTNTEPEIPPQAAPLTPEQVQEAISEIKQQLITLIQQLVALLQEEIASLSD